MLSPRQRTRVRGFTLIELMLVVSIIGTLSAIAIPQFLQYQLRVKSSEAKTNLAAVRVAEEAFFSESGHYIAADPQPAVIPGARKETFELFASEFARLGWAPEGPVYFSYGVATTPDNVGYTIDAGGDIDEDGDPQFWGFVKPDAAGVRAASVVGCDEDLLERQIIGPCGPESGRSVF